MRRSSEGARVGTASPRRRRTGPIALIVSVLLAAGLLAAPPAAAATNLPNSMAALGDSITRAYDVCCWYGDHPAESWSTGNNSLDSIASHYERLASVNSGIIGNQHNDARTGAKASDLTTQVATAVSQRARYITVLIGANDLCTSSPATMTSTTTFASQIRAALATLIQDLPKARIFVSSIPNLYQLWSVLHTNSLATWVWSTAGVCQSMLSSSETEADRQVVVDRENAFNATLATACQSYARCRWDNYATYNYQFSASQVSILDYFHPSLSGQAALARVTWNASWYCSWTSSCSS